jgi:hypothetical protein
MARRPKRRTKGQRPKRGRAAWRLPPSLFDVIRAEPWVPRPDPPDDALPVPVASSHDPRPPDGWTLPSEWDDDLAWAREESALEDGWIQEFRDGLSRSATLYWMTCGSNEWRHRAWLAFLALVDVFLNPVGKGLPPAGVEPYRLEVSPVSAMLADQWHRPWRYGFISVKTKSGKVRAAVMEVLHGLREHLRSEADHVKEHIARERERLDEPTRGRTVRADQDDLDRHIDQVQALRLAGTMVRALAAASDAVGERLGEGPIPYTPNRRECATPAGALCAGLEFALATDSSLPQMDRRRVIAQLLSDFFPRDYRQSEPLTARIERVRSLLKDAGRRERTDKRRAYVGYPGFAAVRLRRAGILPPDTGNVLRTKGCGLRAVLVWPERTEAARE